MAINSTRVIRNKIEPKESCGTMSESSNGPSHVMTLTITTTQSSINSDSRCRIARKKGLTSPYLAGDKVKLSRVTEKKVVHKRPVVYDLSLPSAANVYRANSDEIRFSKRNNKKVKKSVLTLPNESNAEGIVCTVSDVNDVTECNKDQRDRERKIKSRKRLPIQTRKPRIRDKDFEYYDRDARYCSQMNIDLDCSSTDMIKHFNGDGIRGSKKNAISKVSETKSKLDPHDVWAVLRNINQFQFTPSPPMSDYSIQSKKRKRTNKKRNSRKDARVIETCRTEEFAYISSFDVNRSRTSFSQASSIDRITVIDKQDEFSHFCQEFEKKFLSDSKNIKVQNKFQSGNQVVMNKRNNKLPKFNGKPKEKGNQSLIDRKAISNKPNEDQRHEDAVKSNINAHNASTLCLEYKDDIQANKDLDRTNLCLSPYNDTSCSVNSGSSKAGLNDFVTKTKAEGDKSVYSDESNQQLKGITKVVLSKAPDGVVCKRTNAPIRKPRLVTTMPSTMPPKLTQTDIKRRLANKKYPIVILEKDELGCSSIEVPSFEPVQFRGLDQHIWPFMRDWFNNDTTPANSKNKSKNNTSENIQHGKGKHTIMSVTNKNLPENKVISSNEKKFNIHNTRKIEPKRINAAPEPKALMQEQATKSKPMKQFKDKMLKILYKKSTEDFTRSNNTQTGGQSDMKNRKFLQSPKFEKRVIKVDAATDTVKIFNQLNEIKLNRRLIGSPQKESNQITLPITRHPWAKGKWASDFIDSVIKKVKTGIYYSQDKKVSCKKCCKDSKEASIQTALTINSDEELKALSRVEDIPKKEINITKTIPGFDEVMAPIEIKTLNMKQITIKHCLTNVLLQFDVAVPTEKKPISFDTPRSLYTPLTITDSNSKIIKCKTTILNAIMPAELCSIIPKMMRNINFNTNLQVAFPPILSRKPEFPLATITELTQQKFINSFKSSITPFTFMSLRLKAFLAGNFPHNIYDGKQKRQSENKFRIVLNSNYRNIVREILNEVEFVPLLLHGHTFCPKAIELTGRNLCSPSFRKVTPQTESSKCMALQPYIPPKQCVAPTFGIQNVIKLLQHICFRNVVVNFDFPKYFPVRLNDIRITVHPNKSTDVYDVLSVPQNLKIDSLFDEFLNSGDCRSVTSQFRCFEENVNRIEFDKKITRMQDKKPKCCQNLCHNKTKKKCFVRLYKKCKSTSNISIERTSTAICKITNLDHFFQALGSGKLLSSVFDGYAEKKILSSVAEMRNWISDISQRQAMLVLLLTNKKDTPNLVRYRPVLLQGIAVNRITRASELDMEIEVIETENLNKPQYEGISYISTSAQSNNLLEELYWIAKTTASDYQKPFDESSERLLKSLTEKRKKLNPSYLRVMARYVGLGLLKPPKK